jgi:hypothetical protein
MIETPSGRMKNNPYPIAASFSIKCHPKDRLNEKSWYK